MLMVSSIAHADGTDASLIVGMSTIEDLDAGVLVGARFGFTLSDSLALDVQTLRHTGSHSALNLDMTYTQFVLGMGARYYFSDGDIEPFASGHANYLMEADRCVESTCTGASNGGFSIDLGAGARYDFSPAVFGEGLAYYDIGSGDDNPNVLGIALSVGMEF